ncbi:phosphonatase-like hydrolase [Streptacidiphilus sp. PB12-B1b]|uniref:phosphonatase-like hydrolase n=1 Tax=Streptacidiphilus sp. PB12-B1b TaxID=2705012 RepID=UPI0015F88C41|nr:phosphonatase-like hydrolase [Streptacidiphilus sp. PB12-B1b]QMU75379.1 phosphonatase-like hydrolase [Streptacidiphilus sp. PB12-B1b]
MADQTAAGRETGPRTRLVVLDMAGTTVADDGLVEQAFDAAAAELGVVHGTDEHARMVQHVRDTMGESKISVFRALFGDEAKAQQGNRAFEAAYDRLVDQGHCAALPGAEKAVRELRGAGLTVVLTTGFSGPTQQRILTALGWESLADLVLCPADAGGRGRPYPDLALAALLRTGAADDVRELAVVGDTGYDMLCGARSGAGVVAGVLTGAHDAERLRAGGATHVLASVAELPQLLLG